MNEMVDERDIDAAERALGLDLTAGETLADRLLREAWDERLAPLAAQVPAVAPPADLLARIEAAIGAEGGAIAPPLVEPKPQSNVIELDALRRKAGRWKAAAGAAMAIAAALAIYIAVPIVSPQDAPKYVAIVTADDGGQAGLIIQVDTGTGLATVIPITSPPSGQSYEMWHLPQGASRPVSLGLLPRNAVARSTIQTQPGELFAISLEPMGGSPTGQPTLPQFHGTVVEVK
jgi:anti-sigma-K factor RskA